MTATERFNRAISGGLPDRVPSFPKIWLDLAALLTGTELHHIIEDPFKAMELIVRAGLSVGADGARLFHIPARRTAYRENVLVELDEKGKTLGRIDMLGGLATQVEDIKHIHLEDPGMMAFMQFRHTRVPLVNTVEEARRIAVPGKSFYQEYGFGDLQRMLLKKYSHKIALLGDCASATLAFCALYRGEVKALMDLIEQPALIHALMEKGVAFAVEKGKFNIDLGIKMLRLNDSIANMSLISPEDFRKFVFPHMKTVCDELHHYDPEVKIYCHICGNVLPVLEDLVATGLDCIGPLDPLGGVSCESARKIVGKHVALMGGVNTMSFIDCSPGQIMEESRRCIEGAGKSGFVLGSGCAVPRHSKKDNLVAMRHAAELYGRSIKMDTVNNNKHN